MGSEGSECARRGQSVVFSADPKLSRSEKEKITYCGVVEQDVLCINERQVMVRSRGMYKSELNIASEGVSSDLDLRPKTSLVKT